jgi:hypothetical protein
MTLYPRQIEIDVKADFPAEQGFFDWSSTDHKRCG